MLSAGSPPFGGELVGCRRAGACSRVGVSGIREFLQHLSVALVGKRQVLMARRRCQTPNKVQMTYVQA
ncbi:hypothetical protein D3C80_394290 [compost metagenome]